jgi:hypothetical protein
MAVFGMVVGPKAGVREFYTQFGFVPLTNDPQRLFLHLEIFMDSRSAPSSL